VIIVKSNLICATATYSGISYNRNVIGILSHNFVCFHFGPLSRVKSNVLPMMTQYTEDDKYIETVCTPVHQSITGGD
jgi:hypothetical protein